MQHRIGPDDENLEIFGATYPDSTVSVLRQCLYQKEATGMESLKCNHLLGAINVLDVTGQPTTKFHAASYRSDNGDLGNFGLPIPMVPCSN